MKGACHSGIPCDRVNSHPVVVAWFADVVSRTGTSRRWVLFQNVRRLKVPLMLQIKGWSLCLCGLQKPFQMLPQSDSYIFEGSFPSCACITGFRESNRSRLLWWEQYGAEVRCAIFGNRGASAKLPLISFASAKDSVDRFQVVTVE